MKTFILSIACCLALQVSAQLNIDLSKEEPPAELISIETSSIIHLINALPMSDHTYAVEAYTEEIEIEPFNLSSAPLSLAQQISLFDAQADFQNAYDNLSRAASENQVPDLISALHTQMLLAIPAERFAGEALIASTRITRSSGIKLKYNMIITIVVRRYRVNEHDTLIWKKVFKTPVKSPWKVMYGFTFTANWMNYTDEYYSRTDTGGLFRVTRSERSVGKFWENISPTIVFQWTPVNWKSPFKLGAMGGLSLNFTKEAGLVNVMVGPSLVISDNLSISSGIAFVQKRVLSRDYKNGDLIREKLSVDALHDKKYMPEFFITVAFRFDKNPFGQKDKTTEAP